MDNVTLEDEFVGPAQWASPELIAYHRDKKHSVDARSDIFMLGKVIWYLAIGRGSAGIPSVRFCPMGGGIHRIVTACLQEHPDDRPGSVGDVEAMLREILATQP